MTDTVFTVTLTPPPPSRREILRYMQAGKEPSSEELIDECLEECKGIFTYRVCYLTSALVREGDTLRFAGMTVRSHALARAVRNAERVLLFGATVGIGIDRLILRHSCLSPSKALCLQAIGAERTEALCDAFTDFLKKSGLHPMPRFSPGYGDLPLACQRDLFRILDCERKIGLTLGESLMMMPTKSVTAIAGIALEGQE